MAEILDELEDRATEKIGPLPLWAWVGIPAALYVGYAWYRYFRSDGESASYDGYVGEYDDSGTYEPPGQYLDGEYINDGSGYTIPTTGYRVAPNGTSNVFPPDEESEPSANDMEIPSNFRFRNRNRNEQANTFQWDTVTGASNYQVEIRYLDGRQVTHDVGAAGSAVINTPANARWQARIRARGESGWSNWGPYTATFGPFDPPKKDPVETNKPEPKPKPQPKPTPKPQPKPTPKPTPKPKVSKPSKVRGIKWTASQTAPYHMVRVVWSKPLRGNPIDRYEVGVYINGNWLTVAHSESWKADITGIGSTARWVRIRAINSAGPGPWATVKVRDPSV